jgi:hypothetical protein
MLIVEVIGSLKTSLLTEKQSEINFVNARDNGSRRIGFYRKRLSV